MFLFNRIHGRATVETMDLLPDNILLDIFKLLPIPSLIQAAYSCRNWYRVAMDNLLWKDLLYRRWRIPRSVPMKPGKRSWYEECRRLMYLTPTIESQVIREHKDQVLHVSFSHNGKYFATSSKDGFIKVRSFFYCFGPVKIFLIS